MGLCSYDSDTKTTTATIVWDEPTTDQLMENRWSRSSGVTTWYKCTHNHGHATILFLTKTAAEAIANDLTDTSIASGSITCANGSGPSWPCTVQTYSISPQGVTSSNVSKWTASPRLRSDGVGYDVDISIDYDVTTDIGH